MSTVQKYRAEYEAWTKTAKCTCGCRKPLTTSYESYVTSIYRRKRPPLLLPGHANFLKNKKLVANYGDYKQWYLVAHACPECGNPMQHSYRAYAMVIKKTGRPPKHHPECTPPRRIREIKLNGCVLREAQGRCRQAIKCEHYKSCLNAADAAKW